MGIELDSQLCYNIIIVGTGATGSQLLPFVSQLLANYDANTLKICDGDSIELKNLRNQKFTEGDVGRLKSEVLCERYQAVYPNLKISYVDEYVKDEESLIKFIYGDKKPNRKWMPILIGCVDNDATRRIFDKVFYSEKVPDMIYIDSGNGTDNRVGQVVVGYKIGKNKQVKDGLGGYNYYCSGRVVKEIVLTPVADLFPEIRNETETIDHSLSCGATLNEHPQNIATNVLAAVTIFNIINNIIAFNTIPNHISYFNAEKPEIISRC
jgi:hypothetical protein